MIDLRAKETYIVEGLKAYTGCEVVMANQAAPAPAYDYIAYTIINPLVENNGTFSEYDDGVKRKEYQQIWSFTAKSDNDTRSKMLALQAHEFFSETGYIPLADAEISVQRVGGVTCRDNLLTMGYEYNNGFDVTFAFMSEIGTEQQATDETIATASIAYDGENINAEDPQQALDELNSLLEKRLDGEVS